MLKEWHNKLKPAQNQVNHLIEEMTKWQQEGYVDIHVWQYLGTVVNPDLLPESRGVKRKRSEAAPSATSVPDPSTSNPSRKKKKRSKSIPNRKGEF